MLSYTNPYSKLQLFRNAYVSEEMSTYSFFTERHLQIMWLEQKYFTELSTECDKRIHVVSPGIWNTEEGPDFKKAHLLIDGKSYHGDIEIHLSDEGWTAHKHHKDPRYDHVILHLSFWKSIKPKDILTNNGRKITKSYFEERLKVPIKRVIQLIDIDLYPYKRHCGTGSCSEKLFKKLSEESISNFFNDASKWRLEKKKEHIHSRIDTFNDFCAAGICLGLGYKKNSEHFIDLFLEVQKKSLKNWEDIFVILLGLCGFFEQKYKEKWKESAYYQSLLFTHHTYNNISPYTFNLKLANVRPLNHPIRRLVYLAHLLSNSSFKEIGNKVQSYWKENWNLVNTKKDKKRVAKELINFIPTFENDYWNFHYTFEKNSSKTKLSLLGESLKQEIFINTLLPFIYSSITEDKELAVFEEIYSTFTSQKTKKQNYLSYRFFGDSKKSHLLKKAHLLQGAYQLHHDFCVHYESSCEGCPFVERYQSTYENH